MINWLVGTIKYIFSSSRAMVFGVSASADTVGPTIISGLVGR